MKVVQWAISLITLGAAVVVYAHSTFAPRGALSTVKGNRYLICRMAIELDTIKKNEKKVYCGDIK